MSENSIGPVIRDDLFERLGLPNPDEYRARVDLAFLIVQECKRRGLKQKAAADLLDIGQPDFSKLANAKVEGFSQERLEKLLNRLDMHVRIQVGPRPEWTQQAGVAVELVKSF
ncbi:MAG TPA: helix-turn-helix transcriptional regulator [Longimicrobiaceae bacterium]|jgi:predicted XRE-type DNA-binding protein|nr:helix-turn-helix transcriptional regulator [Longimicrobiaceae bacterium]